ncbi:MAG: tRNA lysidine(34) synthetase TilS [Oscillospiraceae bacterium]|nr:tRNA lysidine(34) synthetase TilS [Oscillospiraceae bacterium]
MRSELLRRLRETELIVPGDTVICALSGGADSVAMTHALRSLRDTLGIEVRACHFNHRLRGEESDADEAFCREFCASLGAELTVGSADVRQYAAERGESLEEAARHCRYAFFDTLGGKIATAHTADDQLETVLLQLVRGTGLKGLGGVPPRRGNVIRPMLPFSREEILSYLEENSLPHREDRTNAEDDCLRNRLRHHVVPLLKAENPALLAGVSRMTQTLRDDEALLQAAADALLCEDEGGYAVQPLRSSPQPLRRRALRTLLCGVPKLTAAHLEAAEALLFSGDPSARIDLPDGVVARRVYDRLVIGSDENAAFAAVTLPCPGEASLGALGAVVRCTAGIGEGLHLPAKLLAGGVTVRARKTGDRIRLNGGTVTLKKLMIDRRIPAAQRGRIPVIEKDGNVLAVWGVGENLDFLPRDGEPVYTICVTEREETP